MNLRPTLGIVLAALSPCSLASVRHVDANASGANDGTSWADAFTSLSAGLAAAQPGDEVWVARATYRPAPPGGARTDSFALPSGVAVLGGFAGVETNATQRDVEANPTVLSGDLNGDDGPAFLNDAENSYHVVVATNVVAGTVLDGFTIQGGNADGPWTTINRSGGGLRLANGALTVRRCIFRQNRTLGLGGGMAVVDLFASSVIEQCTFTRNQAVSGGGLHNERFLTMRRCLFIGNAASFGGGGVNNSITGTFDQVENCIFSGNTAGSGGAWMDQDSHVQMVNCTFAYNAATYMVGGIGASGFTEPTLKNCLVWGNTGTTGTTLEQQVGPDGSTHPIWIRSTVQGDPGLDPAGNNGLDPLFADPDGADGVIGTRDDFYQLRPVSPAIDAGNNAYLGATTVDFLGAPRFLDDPNTPDAPGGGTAPIADRGALEHVPCAAPTSTCTTSPNSVGPGALMSSGGSASLAWNNLVLHTTGCPPGTLGIYFYGATPANAPFGNGVRCVGGNVLRLPLAIVDGSGLAQQAYDARAPSSPVDPGETWYFQFWYRNPAGGGAGFNLSDALRVVFCE